MKVMVEILVADAREIRHDFNSRLRENLGAADTGSFQYKWCAKGAA
jgi:hypothetical protein